MVKIADRELMLWDECVKNHIIKIEKDEERARALTKMAALRYEYWSNTRFDKKFASIAVDGYYEVVKELLTALLYLNGYKSDNHECLIAYLKEFYPDLAYEVGIIHQLKNIRNDIDYRGFFVSSDYLERNKLEFKHIIEKLQEIITKKISSS